MIDKCKEEEESFAEVNSFLTESDLAMSLSAVDCFNPHNRLVFDRNPLVGQQFKE